VQDISRAQGSPTLHAGLFADYGEVAWDEAYRVPRDPAAGTNVCDYPLARNLILLTVSVMAETILRAVAASERTNWTITLRDLSIRQLCGR
jgi:hypothetical protein